MIRPLCDKITKVQFSRKAILRSRETYVLCFLTAVSQLAVRTIISSLLHTSSLFCCSGPQTFPPPPLHFTTPTVINAAYMYLLCDSCTFPMMQLRCDIQNPDVDQ